MPRVIFDRHDYTKVISASWYESDFESFVLRYAARIFPDWYSANFRCGVVAAGVTKRPDLALIDHHYREWWVVEVELEHHSFDCHVGPQLEVFRDGRYGATHAAWLARHNPHLDQSRLEQMVMGVPPGVLVVVDSPSAKWIDAAHDMGCGVAIVEPFVGPDGAYMMRVNGDEPRPPAELLTVCRRELRRLWRVESPAALPLISGQESFRATVEGAEIDCWIIRTADSVIIKPSISGIFPDVNLIHLIKSADGSFELTPATRSRRRNG